MVNIVEQLRQGSRALRINHPTMTVSIKLAISPMDGATMQDEHYKNTGRQLLKYDKIQHQAQYL